MLYKPFRDIALDIKHIREKIIENWRNFRYNACHFDCTPLQNEKNEEYVEAVVHDENVDRYYED